MRTGRPTRLQMPSLGFDQPVRAMGLNNGAINPPPHVVQWYTGSVRPGSTGISVIAGHVAPYGGRAGIFSRLNDLSIGDTVTIGYAGGGERSFRVYAKDAVGKTELQRDSRVWGSSSRPVIALITCDSSAPSRGGHSTRNYVVWASPV
ncbi:class F sortase [Barrientosiimonas humi]|uniref:class F sortase n=1 Tax=Barrientosiimonas humi TaxID=999931 RepID=UPI001F23FF55|nr:class F sortase [Barrientosiimonas humi]